MRYLWILPLILLGVASPVRAADDELVFQPQSDWTSPRGFAFSPDGTLMAVGNSDRAVRVWHLPTGRIVRVIRGHDGEAEGLAFSPDGNVLVSGSYNGLILWTDLQTGRTLKSERPHRVKLSELHFSPDGKTLVTSGCDKMIFWDTASWKPRSELDLQCNINPERFLFTPDGKTIVGASSSKFTIIDVATMKLVSSFEVKSSPTVALSPDGRFAAAAGGDEAVVVDLTVPTAAPKRFQVTSWEHLPGASHASSIAWTDRKTLLITYREAASMMEWSMEGKFIREVPIAGPGETRILTPDRKHTVGFTKALDQLVYRKAFTGEEIRRVDVPVAGDPFYPQFRPGTHLFTMGSGSVRAFDFEQGTGVTVLPNAYRMGSWTPDGRWLVTTLRDFDPKTMAPQQVQIWNAELNHPVRVVTLAPVPGDPYPGYGRPPLISADGTLIASTTQKGAAIWDARTGALLRELVPSEKKGSLEGISWMPGPASRLAATFMTMSAGTYISWDATTGAVLEQFELGDRPSTPPLFSKDGRLMYWQGVVKIFLHDLKTKKMMPLFCGGGCTGGVLSPDSKTFIYADMTGHVSFLDVNVDAWTVVSKRSMQSLGFRALTFSDDGQYLLTYGDANLIVLWNLKNDEQLLINTVGNDWVAATRDGYFDASRDGGRLLAIARGKIPFGVDQFAAVRNRPDILLERMQFGDAALREHYHQQYLKRLRRLGLSEETLNKEIAAPEATIQSSDQDGKFVQLKAQCRDGRFPLQRYSVYVNDVPLYGAQGVAIKGDSHQISERVELTEGLNKIEVSCSNAAGAESFRALTSVRYDGHPPRDLYYLGFGVSKYQAPGLDLSYAHKDAADLGQLFGDRRSGFANVHVKTYLNEEVTAKTIAEAKGFLSNAKPDDVFVLFIAGHGVHDRDAEATYYFITHDTDPAKLSSTAANFDLIEGLLQGIPPRTKLFLMDTCESGEADEAPAMVASLDKTKAKSRGIKKVEAATPAATPKPRPFLGARERFIYNDLVRRSGAVVFSSSRGGELSYEDDTIKNGYFTAEIIKALTSPAADTDADKQVSMQELKSYVAKAVSERSQGMQNPTVDRDNLSARLNVPLASAGVETKAAVSTDAPASKTKSRKKK